MIRSPLATTIIAAIAAVLALTAGVLAHDGPLYDYPVTVDDVTVNMHSRSVVCAADGSQEIVIRQKFTVNSQGGAELLQSPTVSWREGTATAWLQNVAVRRDGGTAFRLGPRPGGPQLQLHPIDDGVGPMRRAEVPLPELRSGDVVDWQVELRREALIEGHVFARMNWTLAHPVEQARFSVRVPSGTDLASRSWGPVPEPLVIPEGEHVTWLWRVEATIEPSFPARREVLPQTIVSSARTWDVVGEWYRERLVAEGGEIGEGAGARLIASVSDRPHPERLQGIFDHVRRQLALPHSAPWHDPFTARVPAVVLDSGIGDCKDRAWLIFRALQEVGLIPHLALTGLAQGLPALTDQPPNPLLFDHVLVGVTGPGLTIWLDPTGAAEERIDTGRALDALVLDLDRRPLVEIDRLHRPTG